tara:strand:+ start:477 stop:1031 length:555 start_codon:yes stop_codon:yes gene_type:complete
MLVALVAVHLQAVLVPLWVAMHCRGWWLKSGFMCFSLASLAEMVDHTTTDWVYVNHNSFFNGVFYGALATGLALLTAAVSRSRSWRLTLLLITAAALAAYPLIGKSVAISLQSLLLVLMLCQWWRRFADPRLWLYVLFGVVLTTTMGILLVGSGDPIWHLFIGPCGSLSVISLGWVLQRSSMSS